MYTKKRTIDFHVRMNIDDYKRLIKKAKRLDTTPSEFIRDCINKEFAFFDDSLRDLLSLLSLIQKKNNGGNDD